MAASYILANPHDMEKGVIGMSTAVFESIASLSLLDIANVKAAEPATFKKTVVCKADRRRITLETDIVIKYGENVANLSECAQKRIHDNILQMTGVNIDNIAVNVVGFYFN